MKSEMFCSVCGNSPKFRGDFYEIIADGGSAYICTACARGEKPNTQNTLEDNSANTQNTLGKRCNALKQEADE